MAVSETPWSNFDASDYTPEQWRRACLLHRADTDRKEDHALPVKEPSGALNRNGCHAAAGALAGSRGGIHAPHELLAGAARKLVSIYRQDLQEDPPASLLALAGASVPAGRSAALTRAHSGLTRDSSDSSGRLLISRALPYGETTEVRHEGRPYLERMQPGCCRRSLAERAHKLVAMVQHDAKQHLPLGPIQSIEERADGLWTSIYVSKTRTGDEVLELVNDGAMDGLSVSFRPVRDDYVDGVVVRQEIALMEVSVTAFPAYDSARITAVRSDFASVPVDVARKRLELQLKSWW